MGASRKLEVPAFYGIVIFCVLFGHIRAAEESATTAATRGSRKLRVLALHGYRESAEIYREAVMKWNPAILDLIDLTFLDGTFPAGYPSHTGDFQWGRYFEWYQASADFSRCYNYEQSLAQTVDYMEQHGPFDGLLGFSQGATISGLLAALQHKRRVIWGKSAADLPTFRFLIITFGSYMKDSGISDVYKGSPINIPTLHVMGLKDSFRSSTMEFLNLWVNPVVINLPQGHGFPIFGKEDVSTVVNFLKRV